MRRDEQVIDLQEVLDAPMLKPREMRLLIDLDSSSPIYAKLDTREIEGFIKEFEDKKYLFSLFMPNQKETSRGCVFGVRYQLEE